MSLKDSLRVSQFSSPNRTLKIMTSLSELDLRDAMAEAIPHALQKQAERIAYEMQPELQRLISEMMLDPVWIRKLLERATVEAAATILRLEIQNQ